MILNEEKRDVTFCDLKRQRDQLAATPYPKKKHPFEAEWVGAKDHKPGVWEAN